jgi:hypothetical protein
MLKVKILKLKTIKTKIMTFLKKNHPNNKLHELNLKIFKHSKKIWIED